jgi:sugar phosphate isomerase/epimerase
MIRIGVAQWCLDVSGIDAIYRARELGFAAVHVDAGGWRDRPSLADPRVRTAYRRACEMTEVAITAIGVNELNLHPMTMPESQRRESRCWRAIACAIFAAAELRVPLVFLPSFRQGEMRSRTDRQRTSHILSAACELAAQHQITIASENTLDADDNLDLIRMVACPNLCILLDTYNPRGAPAALASSLWPHLSDQVHAKDGVGGIMGNALLTEGDGGFSEIAAQLRVLGFNGTLILENDYRANTRERALRDRAIAAGLLLARATTLPLAV